MAVSLLEIIHGCLFLCILLATENESKHIKLFRKLAEVNKIEEPIVKKAFSYSVDTRHRVFKSDLYFEKNKKLWVNPVNGILASSNTKVYSVKASRDKYNPDIRQWNNATYYIMSNLYSRLSFATTSAVNKNSRRIKPRMQPFPPISQRSRNIIPPIIYPELLVIVDYSLYRKFNKDIWKTIPYVLAFWNGVDMRFRSLSSPQIRLNIAKILIAEDRRALTYISSYTYRNIDINAYGAMHSKKRWLYDQKNVIPLDSYDMAITMTALTMYPEALTDSYDYSSKIKGTSFSRGACMVDFHKRHVQKIAIINDVGAFDGIFGTAHEIGHLLGASHDMEKEKCSITDGFVMNPFLMYKITSWNWSPCSRLNFQNYLRSGNGTCMFNKPKAGAEIPRYLPGRLMDANEQCKGLTSTSAIEINDFICLHINCRVNENSDEEYFQFGAADGSKCGEGKLCLHGECLYETSIN